MDNIFRKFQREGTWEAIWPELHMALRERLGREAGPSAAFITIASIRLALKPLARLAEAFETGS